MNRLRWYFGNGLAGYLDFCAGILIAALCATISGQTPTLDLLAWGALFALLPDIDLVWPIIRGYLKPGYNHRTTLMHAPIAVIFVLSSRSR